MGKNGIRKIKKIENILIQNTKTTFVLVCNATMSVFLAEAVMVITWNTVQKQVVFDCSSSFCMSLYISLCGTTYLHLNLKV